MYPDPWFLLAVVASFTGYAIYLAGLQRRLVEPNRASWLIWGSGTLVEAVTYAAVNPGTLQSLVSCSPPLPASPSWSPCGAARAGRRPTRRHDHICSLLATCS
ncbi:hypothetical protein HRV97_10770 [Sphingomonas sp. HHU CXW]|uniref:Uncharacterized protein n=1 Tax=Sphingomonas hominis TaxID=2741495 RepID=A0ABX2JIP0_9SPHN|nr:hypothetical protein [Sphingomonas hominis]NTS65644.1 hypothetical protein [Sphingomonas hominis]